MPTADMPAAEIAIDATLVSGLVARQFPELADRSVTPLAHGWDNELFRLGHDLIVRLPRRAEAVALVANEQRWLPSLTAGLPLATSTPLYCGVPDADFPWPWSICAHLPGSSVLDVVDRNGPFDHLDAAVRLGSFLRTFHRPAPPDAPHNDWRGVPLAMRMERFDQHRRAVVDVVDAQVLVAVDAVIDAALAAPGWAGPPCWIHGDVHPGNLVADGGRLCGVVDFGDLTAGDPASDLSVAWTLFDPDARGVFQAQFPHHGDDAWTRARGWTAVLGTAVVAGSADNPIYARMGRRMLEAVIDEDR